MKQKHAFTIVELVIVIAVIAILAAVLIPTFSNVIEKANESKKIQEEHQEKLDRTIYEIDAKMGTVFTLETEALGYDEGKFVTSDSYTLTEESPAIEGYSFVYSFTAAKKQDSNEYYEPVWTVYVEYEGSNDVVSPYASTSANKTGDTKVSITTVKNENNYTITVKGLSTETPITGVYFGYKTVHLVSAPKLKYVAE